MDEKEKALNEALELAREILAEQAGPRTMGRAHRLQVDQFPRLVGILERAVYADVPRVPARAEEKPGGTTTYTVDECPHCGTSHCYPYLRPGKLSALFAANCGRGAYFLEVEK